MSDDESENNIVPTNELAAQNSAQLEEELAKFRNEWKMEILLDQKETTTKTSETSKKQITSSSRQSQRKSNRMEHFPFPIRSAAASNVTSAEDTTDLKYEQPRTNEEKAKYLFDKAVQLEQQGRHYEAIKFYRMAIQLDADIEFKLASSKQGKQQNKNHSQSESESDDENEKTCHRKDQQSEMTTVEEKSDDLKTLFDKFSAMTVEENRLCEKNFPQKVIQLKRVH